MGSGTRQRVSRVLVIDDDVGLLHVFIRIFEEESFYVVAETDARRALARIQSGQGFDVIFSDLQMPFMSGVDFHRALVDAGSDLAARVVFMTGGASDQMLTYLSELPNLCIEKPFDAGGLVELVHRRTAAAVG
jgi:CheY-like chemotaxis protein